MKTRHLLLLGDNLNHIEHLSSIIAAQSIKKGHRVLYVHKQEKLGASSRKIFVTITRRMLEKGGYRTLSDVSSDDMEAFLQKKSGLLFVEVSQDEFYNFSQENSLFFEKYMRKFLPGTTIVIAADIIHRDSIFLNEEYRKAAIERGVYFVVLAPEKDDCTSIRDETLDFCTLLDVPNYS